MISALLGVLLASAPPTSTGRLLAPAGVSTKTGAFPVSMELSPDGKFVAVLHSGVEHSIAVLDATSGAIVDRKNFDGLQPDGKNKDGLYFGLKFGFDASGGTLLFTTHGASDRIDAHQIQPDGKFGSLEERYSSPRPFYGSTMPHFLSSVSLSGDGSKVFAIGNQSFALSTYQGSISVFERGMSKPTKVAPLPSFPLDSAMVTRGPDKDKKLFVSCERDGVVAVVDAATLAVTKTISVGSHPTHLLLDSKQENLYVSCAGSDQVSVIDTRKDEVVRTLLLRPAEQRGLPGGNPLGIALSPDNKTLFAAMSDLNAIAVYNLSKGEISGYIPTGWYPTDVIARRSQVLASIGKGSVTVNPNLPPDMSSRDAIINGDSGPPIRANLKGEVTLIKNPTNGGSLRKWTRTVIESNLFERIDKPIEPANKPKIEHVIYVVKENRTYDQFFGDLPQGNGRKDLLLYGDDVIPNQRALAQRFVLMDNFYACAEMSADGWSWSVAGITGNYVQRNAQYEYSGRKREYDYEGQTNGTPSTARGIKNVNDPPGGYIWDNALKHKLEFKNYGVYIAAGVPIRDKEGRPISEDNTPTMKAFEGRWDHNFRMYDLDYPDSDVWDVLGRTYTKRRAEFGPMKAKSRFQAWKADYDRLLATRQVPPLMLIRFGNDHTNGTTPGSPTPSAMIADNDYAVGQLVEAVSSSYLWSKTAIVIIEDDAQGGYDHVDGHRSVCWVISPWVKKSLVVKDFHNTDSALRTVEWLLGMKPANQFMATARPIDCFAEAPVNGAPYKALLPQASVMEVNTESSYRAQDSARLFHTYREESAPDRELADILWGAAKGAKSPRPKRIKK